MPQKAPDGGHKYTKIGSPGEGGGPVQLPRWKPNPQVQSDSTTGRKPQSPVISDKPKEKK